MTLPSPARLILIILLTRAVVAYAAFVCEECSTGARHFLRE
jgi:hypothetical protein